MKGRFKQVKKLYFLPNIGFRVDFVHLSSWNNSDKIKSLKLLVLWKK